MKMMLFVTEMSGVVAVNPAYIVRMFENTEDANRSVVVIAEPMSRFGDGDEFTYLYVKGSLAKLIEEVNGAMKGRSPDA